MKKYLILVATVGVQLFLLVNLRFTAWPEMLSYPYLFNHGFSLYRDMIHPYPPLLTLILVQLFNMFGYHVWVLQISAWFLAVSNSLIIFLIFRKFGKEKWGLVATVFYALLQPFMEGNMLWFDFVISTPLLLGFLSSLYWYKNKNSKYLIASSLLFASAGLIKQTGGLFFVAFLFWLILSKAKIKQIMTALISTLVLFVPLLIKLLQEGELQGFLNWVVLYPSRYWTKFPGYVQMNLTQSQILVLAILVLPVILLVRKKGFFKNKFYILLLAFVCVGLLSVYPRFSYFHLQAVLPFLVIAMTLVWASFSNKLKTMTLLVAATVFVNYIYSPALAFDWRQPIRFYGRKDIELAGKISGISSAEGKIFLLGVHSGIYVYADRLPAKPWADNFGWYYELPNVQDETLNRWKQSPPEHIFWQTSKDGNWYDLATYQPKQIVEWIEANYTKLDKMTENIWHWKLK